MDRWIRPGVLSYDLTSRYQVFTEGRLLYDLTDQQKNYETNQVPRYNTTYGINAGILIHLNKTQTLLILQSFYEKEISIVITRAFIVLFLSSCRKDLKNVETPENYIGGSFSEVFDAFWNGMNNNYVFWDIDTTNWDNMYKIYKPIFDRFRYQ